MTPNQIQYLNAFMHFETSLLDVFFQTSFLARLFEHAWACLTTAAI